MKKHKARASSSTTRTRSASSARAAAAPLRTSASQDQVDLIGGTFSKSLASIGGWLVGERKVLDYIQHFAQLVHVRRERRAPLRRRRHGRARRDAGRDLAHGQAPRELHVHARRAEARWASTWARRETAVIPIYIRQDLRTIMMWKELLDDARRLHQPFHLPRACRPSSHAPHQLHGDPRPREHLDRGLEAFREVGKKFGVI